MGIFKEQKAKWGDTNKAVSPHFIRSDINSSKRTTLHQQTT